MSSRVLYHLGKRPAQPEFYRLNLAKGWTHRKHGYVPAPHEKVVFLTSSPAAVAFHHAIRSTKHHVYAYEVPTVLIKALGGMNVYDNAPEIIIPERFWGQVRFLGRAHTDTQEFHRLAFKTRWESPRWDLSKKPRLVRDLKRVLWEHGVKVLGLRALPDSDWLSQVGNYSSWSYDLTRLLLKHYPRECEALLLRSGQGGFLHPRKVESGVPVPGTAMMVSKFLRGAAPWPSRPSKEARLRSLLFSQEVLTLVSRRIDAAFLKDSRHPAVKPPVRG